MAKSVKTRFCVISDTHDRAPASADQTSFAYRSPLPSADVLLHGGDLTMVGRTSEYEAMIAMLREADAEVKIVIAGNHDISLDPDYYADIGHFRHQTDEEDVERVRELWTGAEAKGAGILYLEEGLSTFTLKNGARFTIYTSPYQPEFCRWAFAYERDEDRFNPSSPDSELPPALNPVPDFPKVDIMLTHGPPLNRLDKVGRGGNVGCEHLLRAVQRARPRLHCFGHIHEGWGAERVRWGDARDSKAEGIESVDLLEQDQEKMLAERSAYIDASSGSDHPLEFGRETLMVNASIMNVRYKPVNAPWVVDLDLPLAE
ncbi:MAG: hypothetical protein M1819_002078 [Sarea resinae]|nr:MAG: hypothetical protein M1819_002078 [Sarea resinae]